MLSLVLVVGLLGLLFAVILRQQVVKEDPGTDEIREIVDAIVEDVGMLLASEYRILVVSVAVLSFIISFGTRNWITIRCFLVGSGFSTMAGYLGMDAAIRTNGRTVNTARISGTHRALALAFPGGDVMEMAVAGLDLLGVDTLCIITRSVSILPDSSPGASSIALFACVGGGIYTKAADVGADLAGKVEVGIPEDDPRNPVVIADNVGDGIGDVAGMGTDLFESYMSSLISALTLRLIFYQEAGITFPLVLLVCGTIAAIIGSLLVRNIGNSDPYKTLKAGEYSATAPVVICSLILNRIFLGSFMVAFTITTGLLVGVLIGAITEIYTSGDYRFVRKIAKQFETDSATIIINDPAVRMQSTAVPILLVCMGVLTSSRLMGPYGIALAIVGMLSTTRITVAIGAYGSIADNAGGIAEITGLDKNVRDMTDKLDSVGNTAAAIGRGFAISFAVLTALALFVFYAEAMKLTTIGILNAHVIVGPSIGGMLTFLSSAMTVEPISEAAYQMIGEVRRQFRERPGILKGANRPDYASYVPISTKAALHKTFLPDLMVVLAPPATGPILGPSALGGLLTGTLITGVLMAIFMSNSDGIWGNAKGYIEERDHDGENSDSHKAAVAGDTVGDPLGDTSGPSISILIKLTTIVSLVLAPLFLQFRGLI